MEGFVFFEMGSYDPSGVEGEESEEESQEGNQ